MTLYSGLFGAPGRPFLDAKPLPSARIERAHFRRGLTSAAMSRWHCVVSGETGIQVESHLRVAPHRIDYLVRGKRCTWFSLGQRAVALTAGSETAHIFPVHESIVPHVHRN